MDDDEYELEGGYDINDLYYAHDVYADYVLHPVRSQLFACLSGVTTSLQALVARLIVFALVKRILVILHCKGFLNDTVLKVCLIICGGLALKLNNDQLQHAFAFLMLLSPFMLLRPFCSRYFGLCSLLYGLSCILLWQYVHPAEKFMSTRGCIMVMVMKFCSVCFDVDNGALEKVSPFTLFAYLLDAPTVIFGPWISVVEFTDSLKAGSFKDAIFEGLRGFAVVAVALAFVVYSSCGVELLFPEGGFWFAFGVAQSFRFSHYFISWLSAGSAILSGADSGLVSHWWRVEIPRSLVDVVASWDLPMHRFLRKYVFGETRHKGIAIAIFVTYVVSSLLHGLNFQLCAVLLSLGLLTFVETKLRNRLSERLDACVRANKCRAECTHSRKKNSSLALLVNFGFRLLGIYHLAYLGMTFDDSAAESGYSMRHTLSVWRSWLFSSHLITLLLYLFSLFL